MYDFIDLLRLEKKPTREVIAVAQDLKLIAPNSESPTCSTKYCTKPPMQVYMSRDLSYGYWYCQGRVLNPRKKKKRCRKTRSIQTLTFFEKCRLPMWQMMSFIYLWCQGTIKPTDICNLSRMSKTSVTNWASYCREVVFNCYVRNGNKIGGKGQIVEVGEYNFGKVSKKKTQNNDSSWVLGGVVRSTGRVFMMPVPHPCSGSWILVVKHWIEPGTTIISQFWESHNCLQEKGFKLLAKTNELIFKDSASDDDINIINTTWGQIKEYCRPHSMRSELLAGNLSRYILQKSSIMNGVSPFVEFCKLAGQMYDGKSEPKTKVTERMTAYDQLEQNLEDIAEINPIGSDKLVKKDVFRDDLSDTSQSSYDGDN